MVSCNPGDCDPNGNTLPSVARITVADRNLKSVAENLSCKGLARVAKLADAPDLGSGGAIVRGSSPLPGTFQRGWRIENGE
jgi:hypothetical protein